MPKYLISFEKGAMDHITEEDFPQVAKDSHAVMDEAKKAGVYLFAGGFQYDDGDVDYAHVDTDGVVTDGPFPEGKELVGGVAVLELPNREAAIEWAAKIAVACRCDQDIRKFIDDPES